MIKIGRYRLSFRRAFWFQSKVPTTVRRSLFLWVIREARPTDVDKEKRFDIGTPMDHEGRRYYYWRAPTGIDRGEVVVGQALESTPEEEEE